MAGKEIAEISQDRIELHNAIPLEVPLVLYLEMSGYCNLKCRFCPQGNTENSLLKKDNMNLEIASKIVNDIKVFNKKMRLIRVCGEGEPLCCSELAEILRKIHEANITDRIELITNGILLTPDISKEIVKSVDRVVISVEGLSDADYLEYSQTKVDFDRFCQNIRELYAISTEFLKDTEGKCIIHVKIHESAVPSHELRTSFFEKFSNYCDEISIEALVDLWPEVDISAINAEKKFRYNVEKTMEIQKKHICPQMFKGIQIYANGDVTPCCVDWKRVNLLGNIENSSLKDIWTGEKLRKLQMAHLQGQKCKLNPCKDCTMNDYAEVDMLDTYAEQILERIKVQIG